MLDVKIFSEKVTSTEIRRLTSRFDATLRYPTVAIRRLTSLVAGLRWLSRFIGLHFFTQVYATLREPSLPNAGLRSLTQAYAALRRSFVEDSQAYADEFVNWEYAGLRRLTLPFVRYSVSPPLNMKCNGSFIHIIGLEIIGGYHQSHIQSTICYH